MRTREMMEASDGKLFKFKNAAKRYERGLVLGNDIEALDADPKTKEFIKDNWSDIKNLVRRAGNVAPNEQVEDKYNFTADK